MKAKRNQIKFAGLEEKQGRQPCRLTKHLLQGIICFKLAASAKATQERKIPSEATRRALRQQGIFVHR